MNYKYTHYNMDEFHICGAQSAISFLTPHRCEPWDISEGVGLLRLFFPLLKGRPISTGELLKSPKCFGPIGH